MMAENKRGMRILIAGGGTGGHLFPGIALAQELVSRGQNHRILFVGTSKGLEVRHVPQAGFELKLIESRQLKGKGIMGWISGLFHIPRAMWQSRRILREFRPDVVVGVGGYASGPLVLTAWLKGVATMILEQNALPGLTNRILGKLVKRVVVAFAETAKRFSSRKVLLLGNPIRRDLMENFLRSNEPKKGLHLLVLGGSQGAHTLNQVLPQTVSLLEKRIPDLHVVHQTGARDEQDVLDAYSSMGLGEKVEVVSFIDDMAHAYRMADVVVGRAGATSVTELALCKKPSVLIPFPFAADNHQEINAKALVDAGAAEMIRESELDPRGLADVVASILCDPERRIKMEDAAGGVGRPEAARDVAEVCLELAGWSTSRVQEGI